MAPTFELIASSTLTTTVASVTFSSIPQTYTDLAIRLSARCNAAGNQDTINLRVNGLTTSIYSITRLRGTDTELSSFRSSNATFLSNGGGIINGAGSTADTFSNCEIYFPNYTSSQNKIVSNATVLEKDTTTLAEMGVVAGLARTTSSITSIALIMNSTSFVANSVFYLYGIKNS